MRFKSAHNLIIWILALAVVAAPVQAAVSAIDMLGHGKAGTSHCQMQMKQQAKQQNDADKPDCCKSGVDCAKCVSMHGMIPQSVLASNRTQNAFDFVYFSLTQGTLPSITLRPPRHFS